MRRRANPPPALPPGRLRRPHRRVRWGRRFFYSVLCTSWNFAKWHLSNLADRGRGLQDDPCSTLPLSLGLMVLAGIDPVHSLSVSFLSRSLSCFRSTEYGKTKKGSHSSLATFVLLPFCLQLFGGARQVRPHAGLRVFFRRKLQNQTLGNAPRVSAKFSGFSPTVCGVLRMPCTS
jgi:hypothetical protein